MLLVIRILSALALALWFGSMIFFSSAVAPTAFSVLPDRTLAGNVVNGTMRTLHLIAYGAGGLLLLTYLLRYAMEPGLRVLTVMKGLIVSLMLFIAVFSGTIISQPMAEMRAQRGAIEKLPEDDPLRVRFNNLHRISVMLMGVNMLAAIAVISLEQVREARKNAPTG